MRTSPKLKFTSSLSIAIVCAWSAITPARAGIREPAAKDYEYELGRLALANRFYPAAVESFREIVIRYPRDPQAWAVLGNALQSQGDREAAKEAGANAAALYRERVQIFPEDGNAYLGLMRALFTAGRYEAARAVLDEGLQRNPTSTILLAEKERRTAREAAQLQSQATALVTQVYNPEGALKEALVATTPREAKAVLEGHGINFPRQASVIYIWGSNRLIVRLPRDAQEAVEKLAGKPVSAQ